MRFKRTTGKSGATAMMADARDGALETVITEANANATPRGRGDVTESTAGPEGLGTPAEESASSEASKVGRCDDGGGGGDAGDASGGGGLGLEGGEGQGRREVREEAGAAKPPALGDGADDAEERSSHTPAEEGPAAVTTMRAVGGERETGEDRKCPAGTSGEGGRCTGREEWGPIGGIPAEGGTGMSSAGSAGGCGDNSGGRGVEEDAADPSAVRAEAAASRSPADDGTGATRPGGAGVERSRASASNTAVSGIGLYPSGSASPDAASAVAASTSSGADAAANGGEAEAFRDAHIPGPHVPPVVPPTKVKALARSLADVAAFVEAEGIAADAAYANALHAAQTTQEGQQHKSSTAVREAERALATAAEAEIGVGVVNAAATSGGGTFIFADRDQQQQLSDGEGNCSPGDEFAAGMWRQLQSPHMAFIQCQLGMLGGLVLMILVCWRRHGRMISVLYAPRADVAMQFQVSTPP